MPIIISLLLTREHCRPDRHSTITPIRVHHELVLQVFFSVDGEDLQGNPLEGDDPSGVMRMLVLTMPTVLPSVSRYTYLMRVILESDG